MQRVEMESVANLARRPGALKSGVVILYIIFNSKCYIYLTNLHKYVPSYHDTVDSIHIKLELYFT